MLDIAKIDKNMVFPSTIEAEGLTYYDSKKPPFSLFGIYLDEVGFTRLP